MLRVDIFLPPLLGGFLFVSIWYPTRYWIQREQGYKIFFAASIAGLVFLFLATLTVEGVTRLSQGQALRAWWKALVSVEHSGKAALAFLYGPLAANLLNWMGRRFELGSKGQVKDWLVRHRQDALEMLLREAMGDQSPVLITLKNDKIYVGYVKVAINPAERIESIEVELMKSGFRDATDRRIVITTHYDDVVASEWRSRIDQALNEILRDCPEVDEADAIAFAESAVQSYVNDFRVVIVANELRSIGRFDMDMYEKYFAGTLAEGPTEG